MRTTARILTASLVAAIAVAVLAGPAQAVPYRPDGTIKEKNTPPYLGNDIYNNSGMDQTAHGENDPGTKVTYFFRAQNDGTNLDKFILNMNAPSQYFHYKVKQGDTKITDEIVDPGAGYKTHKVLPGGRLFFKLVVKIDTQVQLVQTDYAFVDIDSVKDGLTVIDEVRATTDVTG